MKIFRYSIIPVVLLLVACRSEKPESAVSDTVRVKVISIKKVSAGIPVHTSGILVSSEELKLSFKTGGIVDNIPVNEGNRVKKGEILASLDLSEIRAAVDEAELGYGKALRDFERVSNLYRDSVATLEQKQNASTALELAASKVKVARFNLTHSTIMAPEDGIVLKKFVMENELVSPGYPVILFGSSARFWKVKAGIPDKDLVRISIGDSAEISFDAHPGIKFYGTVDQVGELANPMTGTYEVEISLKKTELKLASGFVATVDMYPSVNDSLLAVPVESVVEADGDEGYIYFLQEDSTVSKTKVDIIHVIGSDITIKGIPEGVKEVISGGAAYLRDGQKVQAIR
jgi:membrane fusion protein, multidrug efflux system